MNKKIRLSERLHLVFEHLILNQDVWDFCCDHGYLAAAAYKSEAFKDIYFVDQVPNLIHKIENKFQQFLLDHHHRSKVFFIAKPAESLQQEIFGTVSITGVGGTTIYEILNQLLMNKKLKASRLILGPHRDNDKLLKLIESNLLFSKYLLSAKKEMTENKKIRTFFIYDLILI